VSDAGFPYLTAQRISVGFVPLLALRVTYVGELGWELYPPTEYAAGLWDLLWEAGRSHGLVAGGYRAIVISLPGTIVEAGQKLDIHV